jgi:methylated-DNA-[protein]-cysteine S-methyltransferase
VRIATPLGPLRIDGTADAVTAVRWEVGDIEVGDIEVGDIDDGGGEPAAVRQAAAQLAEYFAGDRRCFDVPVELNGLGRFQRQVLDLTVAIPYGCTRAYGDLAADLGDRNVVRAVGGALKHNPIAVIVPCHRVVAADGALTGYGGGRTTGGRLDVKKALLEIEHGALQQRLF